MLGAVLACGPSASQVAAESLRGKATVIAVNRAWTLAPWADALYACDPKWWECDEKGYGQDALRRFGGRMFSQFNFNQAGARSGGFAHERVELLELRHESRLITEPGVIGSCHNGGFQALNVLYHHGARKVLLLGFDMHAEKGLHFHADHPRPMGNPTYGSLGRMIGEFHDAERSIMDAGMEVINCTPGSALKIFPMMPVEEALCACVPAS